MPHPEGPQMGEDQARWRKCAGGPAPDWTRLPVTPRRTDERSSPRPVIGNSWTAALRAGPPPGLWH
eukprot:4495307-Alexandrium_andersonii.AAC.1